MAVLSAATLMLQVSLTRIFSVAQFYHFAFLVVSVALLGFGASGSLLVLWPALKSRRLDPWYGLGFSLATVVAYLVNDYAPFDSYSIVLDPLQVVLLVANLLCLAAPFVFAGLLIGGLLSGSAEHAGRIYGANLFGAAAGALLAPVVMTWLPAPRTVLLCVLLGGVSALFLALNRGRGRAAHVTRWVCLLGAAAALLLVVAFPAAFEVRISPYKPLSQLLLNPDASVVQTSENAYTRVDIVKSQTIHSAQGLSMGYLGDLPPQVGLVVDAGDTLPVSQASATDPGLLSHMPSAVAYAARPDANVLILGSGGGMEVLTALANTTGHVTVVEPNALVADALVHDLGTWAGLADNPRVTIIQEAIRSAVEQLHDTYDVVVLTLDEGYHPISSGAFTLNEDYTWTVEALQSYFQRLAPDGLFVAHRWLQDPPSEDLRALSTIVAALGDADPRQRVVAFRDFQLATFVVKPSGYSSAEVDSMLSTIDGLSYDLSLAPRMPETMINQYAQLPTPMYADAYRALIDAPDRNAYYASYPFDITPPTDARPFFFQFFRTQQTADVLGTLGTRFEPFGGSGYLVLFALLAFAVLAALIFVLLPVMLRGQFRRALTAVGRGRAARVVGYFTFLGLAYLLVEVSLIQQYILVLGEPTLAIATVIGALLLFSGLGSTVSRRVPWRPAMIALVILLALDPLFVQAVTPTLLTLPVVLRVAVAALTIAPIGFLMGIPFPRGIAALQGASDLVPWAWAANGSASVISAVLAAILALSLGFPSVLLIGAGLYLVSAVTGWARA